MKRKHKTVLTLLELIKLLKSGRHQVLSKVSSRYIPSLRKLDEEANKFYARKDDLHEAAQYALRLTLTTLDILSKFH